MIKKKTGHSPSSAFIKHRPYFSEEPFNNKEKDQLETRIAIIVMIAIGILTTVFFFLW
jgi:hypothetical protein